MAARNRSRRTDDPRASGAGPGGPSPIHNEADQFSKNLLRDALSCASIAAPGTEVEVVAATQKIDVYAVPDPTRAAEREKMGLLGLLFQAPSLFEPFRNAPSLSAIRRVLCKQLTWHHELERRALVAARAAARSAGRVASDVTAAQPEAEAPEMVPFPWLVVISQGRPDTVIAMYGCKEVSPGVYEAVPGLQMRVVVLAELPRTRATLLMRLLGAGRLLVEALDDLEALPADAMEKSIAAPVLLQFGRTRRGKLESHEEDDVNAERQAWYESFKQQLRAEERAETRANDVLTVLRVRGIAVAELVRARILAEKDPERVTRWLEKAIMATSVGEVIDDPS